MNWKYARRLIARIVYIQVNVSLYKAIKCYVIHEFGISNTLGTYNVVENYFYFVLIEKRKRKIII